MPTWDPQFGEIAGQSVESWLDSLPPAPPVKRSIILATDERTGSEWLCQLMAATGVLGRPAEYFNPWWFKEFIADYPTDVGEQVALDRPRGIRVLHLLIRGGPVVILDP